MISLIVITVRATTNCNVGYIIELAKLVRNVALVSKKSDKDSVQVFIAQTVKNEIKNRCAQNLVVRFVKKLGLLVNFNEGLIYKMLGLLILFRFEKLYKDKTI